MRSVIKEKLGIAIGGFTRLKGSRFPDSLPAVPNPTTAQPSKHTTTSPRNQIRTLPGGNMSATTALESPAQPVTAAHAHIVRAHKRLVREFEKCAAAGERLKAKIGRSKAKLEAELERYKAKPPRFATLAAAQRYYKAKRQALLRAGQNAF